MHALLTANIKSKFSHKAILSIGIDTEIHYCLTPEVWFQKVDEAASFNVYNLDLLSILYSWMYTTVLDTKELHQP